MSKIKIKWEVVNIAAIGILIWSAPGLFMQKEGHNNIPFITGYLIGIVILIVVVFANQFSKNES